MKILVDVGHPAHVHFFKNVIRNLENKGHEIKITARDKEVTLKLLDAYGFKYECRGKGYTGITGKIRGIFEMDYNLYKTARKFKPDILTGIHNPYVAHVGKLLRKRSITFTDTEHAKLANILTFPFTDLICTPACFRDDLGKKHIKYNGYHELSYLHPNYFKPDPDVLDELHLSKDDKFIVMRFVSWDASHDIGHGGFTIEAKLKAVDELKKYGKLFITSETPLPKELEKYRLNISPEKIHDLLHYAALYIGEGATTATEAAILGTPSIYISSLVNTMGNFDELEKKYGLVYLFTEPEDALNKAKVILTDKNIKNKWGLKREKLLKDKIDVTSFITELIINFKI